MMKDERIPADLVLLTSEHKDGVAYLETSTLDGEKHLKPRTALTETLTSVKLEMLSDQEIQTQIAQKTYTHSIRNISVSLDALVAVQKPHPSIYKF